MNGVVLSRALVYSYTFILNALYYGEDIIQNPSKIPKNVYQVCRSALPINIFYSVLSIHCIQIYSIIYSSFFTISVGYQILCSSQQMFHSFLQLYAAFLAVYICYISYNKAQFIVLALYYKKRNYGNYADNSTIHNPQ